MDRHHSAAGAADDQRRGRCDEGREGQDGRLHRLLRRLGRSRLRRVDEELRDRRLQGGDQRALCARRFVGRRAGAEDRRRASRCGDDRRLGHAGRAAVPRARRARLQGAGVRHARADQPRLHPRRRQGGRRHARADRPGDRRRATPREPSDEEDRDGLPRRIPEGAQRADHRRVLGLRVRRLAGAGRRRVAREGRAGHGAISKRPARRDLRHQGAGRHAWRLQLQGRYAVRCR